MRISWEEFEKVDIRVGKIIEISDFPEARKPAYKLKIDFGAEIEVKNSSVQAVGAHTKEELLNSLVCCAVNFPPKQVGPFVSEVLTLGFKNNSGDGWVLSFRMLERMSLVTISLATSTSTFGGSRSVLLLCRHSQCSWRTAATRRS